MGSWAVKEKDNSPPASLEAQSSQRIFVFDLQAVRPVYLRGRDDCESKERRLPARRSLWTRALEQALFSFAGISPAKEKTLHSASLR
ncbi:MAG: hypothetical protein CVU57_26360 [Deltaproteobacteria bacterium HGW-Deltaproteobacteria-15]|nr:MAG: hypothetical protein CVU57_26360 [Deltaproteobacteria bacterium HGW-Deltaproteobacteria-15]